MGKHAIAASNYTYLLLRPDAPARLDGLEEGRVLLVRLRVFQREAQPRGLARWCAHILGHGPIVRRRARDISLGMPRQQPRVGVGGPV